MAEEANSTPNEDIPAPAAVELTPRNPAYSSTVSATRGDQSIEVDYIGKLPRRASGSVGAKPPRCP